MYAAGHPILPPFELQSFLEAMPPHWKTLQEKSSLAKNARYGSSGFDFQAEYTRAHYDIVGTNEAIQLAVQNSYHRTQRAMMGALSATDQGITLIHQAAMDPSLWGDYSIYNCMGCHQDLKKNDTRFRLSSRIPGRPFPASWLTLDTPKIYSTYQSTFEPISRDLEATFNAVPFGDAKGLGRIRESHLNALLNRFHHRQTMERKTMTESEAKQWLVQLLEAREPYLADFWVARQTGWMVCVAIDELIEHGALAGEIAAPMQEELRVSLILDLKLPQRQGVVDRQPGILQTANAFDSTRCEVLLKALVHAATTNP